MALVGQRASALLPAGLVLHWPYTRELYEYWMGWKSDCLRHLAEGSVLPATWAAKKGIQEFCSKIMHSEWCVSWNLRLLKVVCCFGTTDAESLSMPWWNIRDFFYTLLKQQTQDGTQKGYARIPKGEVEMWWLCFHLRGRLVSRPLCQD